MVEPHCQLLLLVTLVLYIADTTETAIKETRYHQEKYFCNIEGLHYDTIDMRCIKVTFSADLIDAVKCDDIYDPSDYISSQAFGAKIKKSGSAGLQYRSVRNEAAICWGLMSPKYVTSAIQVKHFEFVFDGEKISVVREFTMS